MINPLFARAHAAGRVFAPPCRGSRSRLRQKQETPHPLSRMERIRFKTETQGLDISGMTLNIRA